MPRILQSMFRNSLFWPGILLGFSMGGFFDGILLHQILQWHHLFSALKSDIFSDLRMQILADGVFHALMYVLLSIGLWKLWGAYKRRETFGNPILFSCFLVGFGCWHVVDGIFSHWLFAIHRIHPQSANPLLWDLFFFVALGLVPIATGFLLYKKTKRYSYNISAALLVAFVITAAAISAIPWNNKRTVAVVFKPGISTAEVFAAVGAVDARLMWNNKSNDVWVLYVPDNRNALEFYRHGAWFVSGSFFAVGCFTPNRLGDFT